MTNNSQATAEVGAVLAKLAELEAFLDGSGEIDGFSFGERHDTGKGVWWWRKHMHGVFDSVRASLSGPVGVTDSEIEQAIFLADQLDRNNSTDTREDGYRIGQVLRKLRSLAARLPAAAVAQRLTLTGLQIQHMADYIDGDRETELTIAHYDEGKDEETGDTMSAGLYCWFTDYPDEGRLYLPAVSDDEPSPAAAAQAEGEGTNNYHDAYRGARDDLLEWKQRALTAEANNDQLARALAEHVNGQTFMGEPSPTTTRGE